MSAWPRIVLHVDMDAFYAAVEVRDDPSLAGRPLIIGHRGRRGVVSTCSYEARRFGVRSAMPSVRAERLCPQATWLPGRMDRYVEVSRRIRRHFDDVSPLVEPLSIDEAFIDLRGLARDFEHARTIARALKDRIRTDEGLSASVGIAPNKFLAKVASDLEKPDGLVLLRRDDVPARLWPLPIERLWGVGPKTGEKLRHIGVTTVGELLRAPRAQLDATIGTELAAHLGALARGEDDREVVAEHEAKSISEERTYGEDLHNSAEIDRALLARAEGVAASLRHEGLVARTVKIKVRSGRFETWLRSSTLADPTDLAEVIVAEARRLFRERIELRGEGVRLLGVGVAGIEPSGAAPARLFEDEDEQRRRRAALASDAIRARFGKGAIARARLLEKDEEEASSLPSLE